jgi:hypothetical protein
MISDRLKSIQSMIEKEVDSQNFLFGKVYGQLTEGIKEAEEQERTINSLTQAVIKKGVK